MNITANTVASKLFVAFVAASMLVMLATPAKAATATELQAQIDALMAQISALQGKTTPAASSAACTFTKALTVGSQGADVKCLQDYLTPKYFTNAGGSTGYFGSVTAAAVAAWQTANGVMPAAGYFGPVSQAKYAAMMAATPATPGTDDSDDTDDTTSGDLSGEASLDDVTIDSASDDTIDEGQEDAELGVATLSFVDGDAKVTRLDVRLGGADKAWDVYKEVALMVDGDEVARMDASSKSDYISTSGNAGTLRFTGLDLVAQEDEDVEISIVATVEDSVDTLGTYTVALNSLRFVDATDVTSTDDITGELGDTVNITIGNAGGDDELIVKSSSEDPDGTTLELKDDAKSDWYNVFTFDLDTKDSTNDIELTSVDVTLETTGTTSAATFNKLVDDYELVIDGVTIDKLVDMNGVASGNYNDGQTVVLRFDVDGDVTINAGDRVAAELKLKFKSLNTLDEGATIKGSVTGANADDIEAIGGDDLTDSQTSGSATGDVHTLRTSGIDVSDFKGTVNVTTSDTATNSYGEFVMEFDVTAVGSDELYIPLNAASTTATASTSKGAVYKITDSNGNTVTASDSTSASLVIVSGGDDDTAGYVRLDSGDTATLKLTVTFNPTTSGQYGAVLNSVGFAKTAISATSRTTATPSTAFDIDPKQISS